MASVDRPQLEVWDDLSDRDWSTLLVGNGLSINLWPAFNYASLYDEADLDQSLTDIFDELETTNFEHCLECLSHARVVLSAFSRKTTRVDRAYGDVRDALFDAVGTVHPSWSDVPRRDIAELLEDQRTVYTTNYDLCLYWSHMSEGSEVVDYFWNRGGEFDPANTDVWDGLTPVHYLHGALHLWQDDATGQDGKWSRRERDSLLGVRSEYEPDDSRRPLFVSEGTSGAKRRTINQSQYLSFCLRQLRDDSAPTVVFGHSLSEQDQHIIEALGHGPRRQIAVSVYPDADPRELDHEAARIKKVLGSHEVVLFDSTTHPLGRLRARPDTST